MTSCLRPKVVVSEPVADGVINGIATDRCFSVWAEWPRHRLPVLQRGIYREEILKSNCGTRNRAEWDNCTYLGPARDSLNERLRQEGR
jgi:hypothetical protein